MDKDNIYNLILSNYNRVEDVINNSFSFAVASFNPEKSLYEIRIFAILHESHISDIINNAKKVLKEVNDTIIKVFQDENYESMINCKNKNAFFNILLALPLDYQNKIIYSKELVYTY